MNVLRHVPGDTKGMNPSITSTNAMTNQNVVPSNWHPPYFFGLATGWLPRIVLTKSELEGSSTMMSFLDATVAL